MEGYLTFQWGEGFIFKWGVHPMGGICFDGGGGVKKIVEWGGGALAMPHSLWETLVCLDYLSAYLPLQIILSNVFPKEPSI